MPIDGSWTSLVTTTTPGDALAGPVGYIPGSSTGAVPTAFTNAARTVYPWNFDYSDTARQTEYASLKASSLASFSQWHSLYQAKYLSEVGGKYTIASSSTATSAPDAHYILLADGRTVLDVMTLTRAQYQQLPSADQTTLRNDSVFMTYMAGTLGLTADKSEAQAAIVKVLGTRNANGTFQSNGLFDSFAGMSSADRQVFKDQVLILQRRLDSSSLIVTDNFNTAIGDITERFRRAALFASVKDETKVATYFSGYKDDEKEAILTSDVVGYAISSDNRATVDQGIESFMRAERELLSAQLRRESISRNTSIVDPKKDVAQLIYQLQLLYQSEADARTDAGTEEMAQLHRLLSDYAIMQRLVNETLKAYNPKNTDETRRFLNIGGLANDGVERTQGNGTGQDTWITYYWDDGGTHRVKGDKSEDQFDVAPAFHWYLLAGSANANRIGDGYVFHKAKDADGNTVTVEWDSDDPGTDTKGEVYNFYASTNDNIVVKAGGLSEAEMRIVGMFSADPWGSGIKGQLHPLETLYGLSDRPKNLLSADTADNHGSLALKRRDYWDKWSTQLADTVTILNQKNQLKQNEIDSDSKQANRHFDLGNNALRKMNEMLMSIGRM